MSQSPVTGEVIFPGEPAPQKTNWALIGILVVVGLGLLACAVCAASFMLAGQADPSTVVESALSALCAAEYPDLETETCRGWADDIANNHFEEYVDCSNRTEGNARAIFSCLEEYELAPDQWPPGD
jgi:hypothetical protein